MRAISPNKRCFSGVSAMLRASFFFGVAICFLAVSLSLSSCSSFDFSKREGDSPAHSRLPSRLPSRLIDGELQFVAKKPRITSLANGLKVYFVEDKFVPIVKGTLYFRGGSVFEPLELAGLAGATGSLLRDGSYEGKSPQDLDTELDGLAAAVESGIGDEYGTISFSCLAEDLPRVLEVVHLLATKPAFDEERIKLWKRLALDSIARRKDDPETMAQLAFQSLVYGADSPYNRVATIETVNRITKKELVAFAQQTVRPERGVLALSGAVSAEKLDTLLSATIAQWTSKAAGVGELPDVSFNPQPGIYVLDREFEQATVIAGHQGPPRIYPEMYDIAVFNRMYGMSSLDSMLFSEVRSRLGLAYSVYGGVIAGAKAGVFQVQLGTQVSQVDAALGKVLELTKRSIEVPPDEQLLKQAMNGVRQGFVFKFSTPALVAERQALMTFLEYPETFDAEYLANIGSVSPPRIVSSAKKWVDPTRLVIVIVGRISPGSVANEMLGKQMPVYELAFDNVPTVKGRIK